MLVLSTETRGNKVENLYVVDEGGPKNGLRVAIHGPWVHSPLVP